MLITCQRYSSFTITGFVHSDLNEMMQFKNPLISFSSEDEELLSPERRSFSEGSLLSLKGTIVFSFQ